VLALPAHEFGSSVRIWDIPPGYLNRESLLGEHRELHGVYSILLHGKAGYSRHPETLRWVGCLSGLGRRHAWLIAEMQLRGYADRTPLARRDAVVRWPESFVTPPAGQYVLLRSKYRGKAGGRIPLPRSAPELWAQHKYSVMARDPGAYRTIGRRVARITRAADLTSLAEELVMVLRSDPPSGPLVNALEHMWGYVSHAATQEDKQSVRVSLAELLRKTCELALEQREPYLVASTALADLAVFVGGAHRQPHAGD
jgi:hypothetical protein